MIMIGACASSRAGLEQPVCNFIPEFSIGEPTYVRNIRISPKLPPLAVDPLDRLLGIKVPFRETRPFFGEPAGPHIPALNQLPNARHRALAHLIDRRVGRTIADSSCKSPEPDPVIEALDQEVFLFRVK